MTLRKQALLLSLVLLFSSTAFAAVTEVSFSGLPREMEFSITDQAGREQAKGRSDRYGMGVITGLNLPEGDYTLRVGGRTTQVSLGTGSNVIALGLAAFHSLQFYVGPRWFDGALPFQGSTYARGEYTAPGLFPYFFTLYPYFNVWSVPDVKIASHRPFDFFGVFQKKIESGSMVGTTVGVKHISPLATFSFLTMLANIKVGVGYTYWTFRMDRLLFPLPQFQNVDSFSRSDHAFRWEVGFGLEFVTPGGLSFGIQKTNGFTYADIFNGDRTVHADGSVAFKLGYRWGGADLM